jgi:competence protein ComEA
MGPSLRFGLALASAILLIAASKSPGGSELVWQSQNPDKQQEDDRKQAEAKQAENREVLAQLPDGEGKGLIQLRCTFCHSLSRVASGRKSLKSWTNTVKVMVINGAEVESGEVDPIAKYLAENFPPVININKASASELATVPSLDSKLADAIVAYREKNGPFQKIEDLAKVEGFNEEILKKIKNRVGVGTPDRADEKKEKQD